MSGVGRKSSRPAPGPSYLSALLALTLCVFALPAGASAVAVYNASKNGDMATLSRLLDRGEPVDYRSKSGRTPLHGAALNGHAEIANRLLAAGADVDAKEEDRWTALHMAAQNGHDATIRVLLNGGADANARTDKDATALRLALRKKHAGAVRILAGEGDALDAYYGDWTLLGTAASKGDLEAMELLLAVGADPDQTIRSGQPPLYLAAQKDKAAAAKLLADAGADLNAIAKDGRSALGIAAYYGFIDVGKVLVAAGADTALKNRYGQTPLNVAARQNQAAFTAWLESTGTSGTRHQGGWTPLHDAARKGELAAAQQLIASGTEASVADENGMTPMHVAARHDQSVIINLLLANGASLESLNKNDRTPIFIAARTGSNEALALLIARGANIDATDVAGGTPLHGAILEKRADAVQILLDAGADVGIRSNNGSDALALAAVVGDPDIVAMLTTREGAVQGAQQGDSLALFNAVQQNKVAVVKQLIAAGADPSVRNDWGFTLWHAATSQEVGELLAPLAIDLNAVDIGGSTALALQAFNKNTEVALLLIQRGADVNISNHYGTPLHIAISNDLKALAAALLEAGTDLALVDNEGRTPEELARAEGSASIKALFE
ncbi:MAG: ankyrin repeat domain-containing protein [Pseudomonadota bacterium]